GERAVSIPYDPTFVRTRAHHSNLYWGCSIGAWEHLARNKGYALVGSNSAGNNVFMVRRDRLGGLREVSAREAYVESKFRESRDSAGNLSYISGKRRRGAMSEMPLVDVERGTTIVVGTLDG